MIEDKYIKKRFLALNAINMEDFDRIYKYIDECEGTIYICGNGGSATTAQHWTLHLEEIGKTVKCLVDNIGIVTALANDNDYEYVFEKRASNSKKEDVLILISGSGWSPNLYAIARTFKGSVIGIFAYAGTTNKIIKDSVILPYCNVRGMCDFVMNIEAEEYGTAEDVHLILIHMIFERSTEKA